MIIAFWCMIILITYQKEKNEYNQLSFLPQDDEAWKIRSDQTTRREIKLALPWRSPLLQTPRRESTIRGLHS